MIKSKAGNASANSRLTRSAVAVRSVLAVANRSASWVPRLKARITRTPVICSRITWLMRSILSCIDWNRGTAKMIMPPMTATIKGTATIRTAESGTLVRSARIRPPMPMMGATTRSVSPSCTNICTCWTSSVLRVIKEAVPNRFISWAENCWTRSKTARRTSRPSPMDAREA